MATFDFKIVQPTDEQSLKLIADWYFLQWKIPVSHTIEKLRIITADKEQFQVLMMLNGSPIATGGIYDHVGLLDKEPRLSMYKKWLALVYTIPWERDRGYGAAVCSYIQEHSRLLGLKKLHLFTDTAESLYRRLGWIETERLTVNSRNIVVMEKTIL